jgi:hypothetical protein
VFLLGLQTTACEATDPPAEDVTFHADVLPIPQTRCQDFHRPGEAQGVAVDRSKAEVLGIVAGTPPESGESLVRPET